MSHDEWLERADIYALGALDGEELGRFEDHLDSGCEECDRHVREAREVLLQIPRSLPQSGGPSPEAKRRLMEQLAAEASVRPARIMHPRAGRGLNWGRVGLAASVALLIGLAGFTAWDDWNHRAQLRDTTAEAVQLRAQLVQRKDVIRYLEDPEVAIIPLTGLAPSPAPPVESSGERPTGRGIFWPAASPPPRPERNTRSGPSPRAARSRRGCSRTRRSAVLPSASPRRVPLSTCRTASSP